MEILFDRERAQALVEAYADLVLRLAYTQLGDLYDAQDVCQDVLLTLLTAPMEKTEDERARRAWVCRVTVNRCKNLMRDHARHRALPLTEDIQTTTPFYEDGPVTAAVRALPEKYRRAVFLRYYADFSVDEVSMILGISPAKVSTNLYRAKKKLKSQLGDEFEIE